MDGWRATSSIITISHVELIKFSRFAAQRLNVVNWDLFLFCPRIIIVAISQAIHIPADSTAYPHVDTRANRPLTSHNTRSVYHTWMVDLPPKHDRMRQTRQFFFPFLATLVVETKRNFSTNVTVAPRTHTKTQSKSNFVSRAVSMHSIKIGRINIFLKTKTRTACTRDVMWCDRATYSLCELWLTDWMAKIKRNEK